MRLRGCCTRGCIRQLLFLKVMLLFCLVEASYALDITLEWDANAPIEEVVGYRVYYKTDSSGGRNLESYNGEGLVLLEESGTSRVVRSGFDIPVQDLPDPSAQTISCRLSGLDPAIMYFFVVTAFDAEGLESSASREVSTDNTAPETPSGLTSSHSPWQPYTNREIEFSWSPSTDPPPGSGLSGYSILFDNSDSSEPSDRYANFSGTSILLSAPYDGLYYFHLRALDVVGLEGVPNASATVRHGPVWIETGPPSVLDRPMLDIWEGAVYVIYSEAKMVGADSAAGYEIVSGVTPYDIVYIEDLSGEGRIFRLQISNFDPYLIYRLTIKENITDYAGNLLTGQREFTLNDDDLDGMADEWERSWDVPVTFMDQSSDTDRDGVLDVDEYSYSVEHPEMGAGRWALSPKTAHSDSDGIPDGYEMLNGLNPTDPSDGPPNYQEYVNSVVPPVIKPTSDYSAVEGVPYTGPNPTLSEGSLPVTWSLVSGPTGMEIDPVLGVVYWAEPALDGTPYTITIRAKNLAGEDDNTFLIRVVPYHINAYVNGLRGDNRTGIGTPESPWKSIGFALSEVQASLSPLVTIRVSAGSYSENLVILRGGIWLEGGWNNDFSRRWDFVQDGVEPTSEYETVIDGRSEGSVILAGTDTEIDGFTITGGKATNGGGISGGDGTTVSNCKIIGNWADVGGGGIYLDSGTGEYARTTSITRCLFANNIAQLGGGIYINKGDIWYTVISHCLFRGNSADSGGGLYNTESLPYTLNCTFSGNVAGDYGGGIANFAGSMQTLTNSILWGNTAGVSGNEIYNDSESTAYISFSDIRGCGGS